MSTLRLVVGILVTLIWSATWILALLHNDYSGTAALTPLMILVVGGIFSDAAIKAIRNGKEGNHGR